MKLGTWGSRNSIHIFFPKLASKERCSPQLSSGEIRTFYERGLLPYIKAALPEAASDWPPGHRSEIVRGTGASGQCSFRTVMLPRWLLPDFGSRIRDLLGSNGVEWAGGLFFLHTIRGIKHATQHSMTQGAAAYAFEKMLSEAHIPEGAVEGGSWWIDVGLEFCSAERRCLQWLTASHRNVAKDALGIDAPNATRITTLGSTKYSRDLASHLPAVSGCRIEPGNRAQGRYEAAYLQLYTTDKSVTYEPQTRQRAKAISVRVAMGDPMSYIRALYEAYAEASQETHSNARIEVRVPAAFATDVLIDISHDAFRRSMLSFQTNEWWWVTPGNSLNKG